MRTRVVCRQRRNVMKNPMDRQLEKRLSDRAVAIGRAGEAAADFIEEAVSIAAPKAEHRCQRYDAKFRIIGEFQIRSDFYLPELDLYIEYWGLDTPQYKMSMYKKQMLYQQEGKRLVSVYPRDLPNLGTLLTSKLRLFGYSVVRIDERSEVRRSPL